MELMINGKSGGFSEFEADELAQAVLISLFSWRRSSDDDGVAAPYRQGWWGDTFALNPGDQIGSKLWLLRREKLTQDVIARAQEYAKDALKWLIEDAVVEDINVVAERGADDRLDLQVVITKPRDVQAWSARFTDIWGGINGI